MTEKTTPLNPENIKTLEKAYEKGNSKLKKVSVLAPILGITTLFLPPEFWNFIKFFDKKRSIRNLEDISKPMYQNTTMIVIIMLAVAVAIVFTYFAYVHYIKKDLKEKIKLYGEYDVVRVEHLSRKVAENLDGLDTVLRFEKNDSKIKKHLFNKSKNPELLNAKKIMIERSKNSGITFLEKIIE